LREADQRDPVETVIEAVGRDDRSDGLVEGFAGSRDPARAI